MTEPSELSYFDEDVVSFVIEKAREVSALMEKTGLVSERECYDYCVLFFTDLLLMEGTGVLQRITLEMTLDRLAKESKKLLAADSFSAGARRQKDIVRNFFQEDNFVKQFRLMQADTQKALDAFGMSIGDRGEELRRLRSKNASFFLSKHRVVLDLT